ncbi:MAG: hypothetical protein M1819_004154 [Sarea resinae]|nr:MAG: hypothetical protein M1819_004154 [Sarea resinae]
MPLSDLLRRSKSVRDEKKEDSVATAQKSSKRKFLRDLMSKTPTQPQKEAAPDEIEPSKVSSAHNGLISSEIRGRGVKVRVLDREATLAASTSGVPPSPYSRIIANSQTLPSKQTTTPPITLNGASQSASQSPPANTSKSSPTPPSASAPEAQPTISSTPEAQPTTSSAPPVLQPRVMQREIDPLSSADVRALFSGAPHFYVEPNYEGQPQAYAAFLWDLKLEIRDVSDCPRLPHPSFSTSTLKPHLPLPDRTLKAGNRPGEAEDRQWKGAFDIGLHELPSMLSFQGTEPGTVGFDHFLELPIADALQSGEDTQPTGNGERELDSPQRSKFLREGPKRGKKIGLRSVDMKTIVARLHALGDMYHTFGQEGHQETILKHSSHEDLYTDLFTRILYPPTRVQDLDAHDPYSLKVQVESLVKVLSHKLIWIDFNLVEWRIRIGQILWGDPEQQADYGHTSEEPEKTDAKAERKLVLLQILLACELLLRLDAVVKASATEVVEDLHVTTKQIRHFNRLRTLKVDWDLIVARRFLENIHVVEYDLSASVPGGSTPTHEQKPPPKKPGWFWTSAVENHLIHHGERSQVHGENIDALLLPRHPKRQLAGLLHFARTINWPHLDTFATRLEIKLASPSAFKTPSQSTHASPAITPSSVPPSATSTKSGYFPSSRPAARRNSPSQYSRIASSSVLSTTNAQGPGGWLSKSWLTGLVLPGEAISHFLISALLENDANAIERLGDSANLYGGIVYEGRSWWSKACIVGRVLAVLEGSTECMGWICAPVVPHDFKEGWVDVEAKMVRSHGKPRIKEGARIARESEVLGRDDEDAGILPGDFTLPYDKEVTDPGLTLTFGGLTLLPTHNQPKIPHLPGAEEIDSIHAYSAYVSFSIENPALNPPSTEQIFHLSHDVYFITSYPCHAPLHTHLLSPPSTPRGSRLPSKPPPRHNRLVHPLHKDYAYDILPLSSLLYPSEPPQEVKRNTVHFIDARGGGRVADLLARAWCTQKGESAIRSGVQFMSLRRGVR